MIDQFGHRMVERGYNIIPTLPAKKRPSGLGWQKIQSTPELVQDWITEMPEFGIGVLCDTTAAVDIDCHNKALNNRLLHWLKDNVGMPAARIGLNPKCVVPFRNVEGMRKMRSKEFVCGDGVTHAVEILGVGQQFIAYGIHPKTLKPYEWVAGPTLADVFHEDLPALTSDIATAFITFFEKQAEELGWVAQKEGTREKQQQHDELMNFKAALDMGAEEISEILSTYSNDDLHYDDWVKVGMALHHQFAGEVEGLELWTQWSAESTKYEDGTCEAKWESFGDYQGARVTMASLKFEVKKSDSVEVIEERLPSMLTNWAFVQVEGSARVLREELNSDQIILYKLDDLKKEFANQKVLDHGSDKPRMMNLADMWLEHPDRRTYAGGICFSPDGQVLNKYNLWRGWSYKPVQGDVSPFIEFVTNVIAGGDEGHAKYILGWVAQMIQKPQSKVGVGITLRGKKGSGKSFFGELIGGLCKPHHRIVSKADHVTGKFNRHLEDTLLLQCDEAYWARNKAAEGALKDLMTNNRITVERKGMDSYSSNNYTRLLFTSNEEWVVPASLDERRFAVFDVSPCQMQNAKYFGDLRRWYDRGGAEHLLHFFKSFDLSSVDVRVAPSTAALDQQKLLSLDTIDQWMLDCISAGEFREQRSNGDVFEFGSAEAKHNIYQTYVSSVKGRFENARKESQFWKHLHEIDGLIVRESRKRVADRQLYCVEFAHPKIALQAFLSHHNIKNNEVVEAVEDLDPLDPANWSDEVPF